MMNGMMMQEELREFLKREDRFIPKMLAKVEKATSVNREHLLYGFGSICALYLTFADGAPFLCHLIGVVYPVCATAKSIQLADKDLSIRWLYYWIVFGLYCLFDGMGSWPFYWLVKCIILIVLCSPTSKAAERVYTIGLAPIITRLMAYEETKKEEEKLTNGQTTLEGQQNGHILPAEPDGKKIE